MEEHIFMLFEGDLSGLGNPEGWNEDLSILLEYSKKLFNTIAWFHNEQLLDAEEATAYFRDSEMEHNNCLWLIGERGQECVILRMNKIISGQDPDLA